jgi:RNA 2',3'-cyclic 3'-phosphodiesterase
LTDGGPVGHHPAGSVADDAPERSRRSNGQWQAAARRDATGRRLFFAVPVPGDTIRAVAALVEGVRATDGVAIVGPAHRRGAHDVRWVRLDDLHLTLRFLGPTPDERLPELTAAVHEVAGNGRPFEVRLAGAGAFPSPERPRALWLGVAQGTVELAEVAAGLDSALVALGWPADERPFRPHLTLARSDGVRAGPRLARRLMAAAEGFSITWRAERLVLFESLTGGGRARYVPLAEARLGG